MRTFLTCMVAAFLLGACAHGAGIASRSDVEALRTSDAALQKAVSDENLEAIMAFYAEDAVLLPAAEPLITGKAAIREEWQHILAIPDFQSTSAQTQVEVASAGDLGYSMGTYLTTMLGEDGKPVTEPGKWLSVWKRQADGAWRVVVETYNTDIPPPDHK